MKRIALYARVSMSDQNPEAQLLALREYAQVRQFTITREYVDQVTGDISKRKPGSFTEYQKLLDDAHHRPFDAVAVWKFDRFARSLKGLLDALELFHRLGIDFISITQLVDTTTPAGRLFFQMVGAFAEFERSLIVERVNAGLSNARKKGIVLGRPPDRELHAKIRDLRAQGMSLRKIAAELQIASSSVQKVCAKKVVSL